MEEFRDIPGYEDVFQISENRRVKSLERIVRRWGKETIQRERILKPFKKGNSIYINLNRHGKQKQFQVERLFQRVFNGVTYEKTSMYEGVYLKNNRWNVNVKNFGKPVWIGSFETEHEAYVARCDFIKFEESKRV